VLVASLYWSTSVRKLLWATGHTVSVSRGRWLQVTASVLTGGADNGRLSMGRLVEYLGAVRTVDFS